MGNYIQSTIESLWLELVDSRFNVDNFVDAVLLDCGHDASGISKSDFLALLSTGECDAMDHVAWCCDEALAFYTTHDLGSAEFVRAIFIALSADSVIKKGYGNWDFVFDKICVLLVQNLDKVDYQFRMNFLKRILCPGSEKGEAIQ